MLRDHFGKKIHDHGMLSHRFCDTKIYPGVPQLSLTDNLRDIDIDMLPGIEEVQKEDDLARAGERALFNALRDAWFFQLQESKFE